MKQLPIIFFLVCLPALVLAGGISPLTLAIPWLRIGSVAAVFLLALAAAWFSWRIWQQQKRNQAIQNTINYFAHSGYEHSSVNDILWDICRNCISRLGLEDCVIYLLDEEKGVLVQKAAFGPKSPSDFEIFNPIEIPLGKGIVGYVAKTGQPSLVNNTSLDNRYIVDDERRYSELTVPLVHEGKVIGVIDSEHRRRNFFKPHHLLAIQSIAAVCSANISSAMAKEAMKKTEKEMMELNIRMAESRFLNLRLQMNPHFLFNSLSSIQHLIVSQQTTQAYKYLTIFSNFLRMLLQYADRNFIPLDEELKILKMYVELESLRFDQSFQFDISVDESLANESVLVPSLMVQPFAENAIWHGLLHKEGEKKLRIRFSNIEEEVLCCVIEDNGIGRLKAAQIQQSKLASRIHESKGISIIKERLELLEQKTGNPASIAIEDNLPAGTRVTITIPYYNPGSI